MIIYLVQLDSSMRDFPVNLYTSLSRGNYQSMVMSIEKYNLNVSTFIPSLIYMRNGDFKNKVVIIGHCPGEMKHETMVLFQIDKWRQQD